VINHLSHWLKGPFLLARAFVRSHVIERRASSASGDGIDRATVITSYASLKLVMTGEVSSFVHFESRPQADLSVVLEPHQWPPWAVRLAWFLIPAAGVENKRHRGWETCVQPESRPWVVASAYDTSQRFSKSPHPTKRQD